MNEYHGGKLIGEGSFGCVFHPALNCKGEKIEKGDKVSKVFFGDQSFREANEELKHDNIIKGIKGYDDWSHTWDYKCKPPVYKNILKVDKDIKQCLNINDITIENFDKHSRMLQGNYAGDNLTDVISSLFTKDIFNNKNKFTKNFLKLMSLSKQLFVGLNEMYKHGISHNDIKSDNILVHNDICNYIDFGMAAKHSEYNFFKTRSMSEFLSDRIYIIYPYEFIYMYTTDEVLQEELDDLKYDIFRSSHNNYKLIHETFFKRKSSKKYLLELINIRLNEDIVRKKKTNIISLLDTYSLGILIPYTLCKLSQKYNKLTQLKKYIELEPINRFVTLFKYMSTQNSEDRIKPPQVLKRYLELEKLYLKGISVSGIQKSVTKSDRDIASQIELRIKRKGDKKTLRKNRKNKRNRVPKKA